MGLNEIERPKEWIRGKRDGGNIVQQTAQQKRHVGDTPQTPIRAVKCKHRNQVEKNSDICSTHVPHLKYCGIG